MKKKFLTDIKIIKKAINTKKLVVFAGAGISIDAGVPSWGKLIDEIKKELDLPDYENDYLKIPQIYFNERQEKEYIEKVRSVLKHNKIKHNEIHEEIFELNPEHILTTNFEDLLEQVINKKSLPFSVVTQDKDLPYSYNTKLLVKIHGDLNNTDFVLKEDDYLNYSKNHPLIEAFINSIFASKTVLFIGYSFSDYNLKQIVQNVRNILGSNFQNAYLLSVDENVHSSHKEYLKNKGIKIINYYDSLYVGDDNGKKNYIEEFLNKGNIYNEEYLKKINHLSEKGQKLLNLLKFIRFYDELKVKLNKNNVLNQLSNSLDRFSDIEYLPQDFISKLYPFKNTSEQEYLIEKTTLLLKNKFLVEWFFNKIKVENNKVKYITENKLAKKTALEIEKKSYEILKRLNNSMILNVKRHHTIIRKGTSRKELNINVLFNDVCSCTSCKFKSFLLDETIKEVVNYSINEISEIQEDIQKAYLRYKLGDFLISYKMFEEIATKCWLSDKYISYYISKTNMKLLKNLINYEKTSLSENKKKELIREIEDIDSDKLISQIPYKSNEEYELLKIIRDDSVLKKAEKKIDELYVKTKEIYSKFYENSNYFYSGPYYPNLVYIELYKLKYFYSRNYIIRDVFYDFKSVIQKGMKTLVLLHKIKNNYGERLEKLSDSFFFFSVFYCNADELISFLSKYNIEPKDLTFKEDAIDKIIYYCLNFFKSFFNKNIIDEYESNNLVINQLNKKNFNDKTINMFQNIMVILLSIEIPEKYYNSFSEKLLLFLKNQKILESKSITYLNNFITKNYHLFNEKDIKELLYFANEKISKFEMYRVIKVISYIHNKNNLLPLSNKKDIYKLLNDYVIIIPRI